MRFYSSLKKTFSATSTYKTNKDNTSKKKTKNSTVRELIWIQNSDKADLLFSHFWIHSVTHEENKQKLDRKW
jgi:hypothetical protein